MVSVINLYMNVTYFFCQIFNIKELYYKINAHFMSLFNHEISLFLVSVVQIRLCPS